MKMCLKGLNLKMTNLPSTVVVMLRKSDLRYFTSGLYEHGTQDLDVLDHLNKFVLNQFVKGENL